MLRFSAEVIAQSAIYLAAKKKNLQVLWNDIDVNINISENSQNETFRSIHYDVMYEIISIYDKPKVNIYFFSKRRTTPNKKSNKKSKKKKKSNKKSNKNSPTPIHLQHLLTPCKHQK